MAQKIFDLAKDGPVAAGIVFINLAKVTNPTPIVGGSTVLSPLSPTTTVAAVDGVGGNNEQANASLSSLAFDPVAGKVYVKIANTHAATDWKELTHAA